jgi:uncharacterized protein
MTFTKKQSEELLSISRKAISHYLEKKEYLKIKGPEPWMKEHRATFVTIKIKGELRGCIGHLRAVQELHKEVIENSVAAAFFDPRFSGLRKEEVSKIHIEISVLSYPEKLFFSGKEDLLSKLSKEQGVILVSGFNGSTFLPQVWEELPDKKEFLTHLCMKAGLPSNFWETSPEKLEIQTYTVEAFEDK